MLDHPGAAARMAAAAHRLVAEQFSAKALGRELADAYATALAFAMERG